MPIDEPTLTFTGNSMLGSTVQIMLCSAEYDPYPEGREDARAWLREHADCVRPFLTPEERRKWLGDELTPG